jgi:hypothetical protein
MSSSTTATVETLTAEVRTLVVGSRQVTLSVYNQLDEVPYDDVEPFGRVSPRGGEKWKYNVVGRSVDDGTLVRAWVPTLAYLVGMIADRTERGSWARTDASDMSFSGRMTRMRFSPSLDGGSGGPGDDVNTGRRGRRVPAGSGGRGTVKRCRCTRSSMGTVYGHLGTARGRPGALSVVLRWSPRPALL